MSKILVIEDEQALAQNIAQLLRESCGYAVDICHDGQEGLHQAKENDYDLVLLDLMLPKLSGLDLLTVIRNSGSKVPVLILTAKGRTEDVVAGLNHGADDYVSKPFEISELTARCKALIRRHYQKPNPFLEVSGLSIDTLKREVRVKESMIELTAMEYRTLEYIVLRKGEVVSKAEISEHLYDFRWERYSNVIESYVSSLRKKINAQLGAPVIHTLRGHGYKIDG